MKRLATWLAGALAMGLMLPGCTKACTLIGGLDGVTVEVPWRVQSQLHTINLTVCSEGDCKELTGSAQPRRGAEPGRGIFPVRGELWVNWNVPASWEDQDATLAFQGLDRRGRPVVRHAESFRFEPNYPNGEGCDKNPFLHHVTSVGRSDRPR